MTIICIIYFPVFVSNLKTTKCPNSSYFFIFGVGAEQILKKWEVGEVLLKYYTMVGVYINTMKTTYIYA